MAVAAALEEESDENVYKSFYLSGITCFMPSQYSNHKSPFCFKADLWERGNWKEKSFWVFYKFGLVIAGYKKPDHPLPSSKTTLAAQGSRSKKWPSNYCDWKSIQELCNTLQCSLAPFFHWKLPNEYISLNLQRATHSRTLFSLKAHFTWAKFSNGCQITPLYLVWLTMVIRKENFIL